MAEFSIQVSVNDLLDRLCKSVHKDVLNNRTSARHSYQSYALHQSNDKNQTISAYLLRKCKLRSYEILLKKSAIVHKSNSDEGFSENLDPLTELRYSQFVYNLYVGQMQARFHAYGHVTDVQKKKIMDKHRMFIECVDFVENNPYFRNKQSDGQTILMFLILLKDFGTNTLANSNNEPSSYFNLRFEQIPRFRLLEPKLFKLNWEPKELENNPYYAQNSCNLFTGAFKSMPLMRTHSKPCSTQFQLVEQTEKIEPSSSFSTLQRSDLKLSVRRFPDAIQYTSNKWEELGHRYTLRENDTNESLIQYERKFVSESNGSTLHLMAMMCIKQRKLFQACIVPLKQFIEHLKSLSIGIESESFQYNAETMSFNMFEHITIENVMPESIEQFVRDFIECGTCYKRLKLIIERNVQNFKLKYEGFVFKAMCSGFDKYLETFRLFVMFGVNDDSIIQLYLCMVPLIKQIRVLAKVLTIHPDDNGVDVPRGSEFLGYLYKRIIAVTQTDVSMLLVFILTECCDIYFRHFENWIFHGTVDDPCKELFIEFVNHYQPKTKFYFDKAHIVKRQSVPGFLQGWENSILLCGKYANLLKMYNPTHTLFTIKPPPISVCLSFKQLEILEIACDEYKRLAQTVCGEPLLISDIFKRKAEKRRSMAAMVAQKCQNDLERWKFEQNLRETDRREQKEKERVILLQQIQEIREQKIQKRREQLKADREYLHQSEVVEMELIERENAERRKNIEYYTELGEIVDAQRKRTEKEIKCLQQQLKGKEKVSEKNVACVANSLDEISETNDSKYFSPNEETEAIDSDDDLVFYDANKSESPVKSVTIDKSVIEIGATIPRSASDFLNSNATAADIPTDLQRNRANILSSNINLTCDAQPIDIQNKKSAQELTGGQKKKLKTLQQEYNMISPDSNSNEIIHNSAAVELTDLQRNRNKALAHEYGTTNISVTVPIVEKSTGQLTEFERNKKQANSNEYDFNQAENDCNANKPLVALTDLQRNRQKVMMQEYHFAKPQPTTAVNTTNISPRSKLKSSLSLDLDDVKQKHQELYAKPCRSDFVNSPMSTTSDSALPDINVSVSQSEINEDQQNGNIVRKNSKVTLKLDTNCCQTVADIDSAFTADAETQPTPIIALNTAGINYKKYGFVFDRSPNKSQIYPNLMLPSFSSKNLFDLSARLNSARSVFKTVQSTASLSNELSNKAQLNVQKSMNELCNFDIANLTNLLQQSFILPLQVHLNILNNEILKIYFEDFDILGHFQSLRNYFFMMDGEFASNISDGILSKLHGIRKPSELLNSHTLHSILENALHSSVIGNDKNAENLSFIIPNVPEQFDMASPNVLKELHLSYRVDWPLNLLLSPETIEHYGNVFQHLIKLRRITWLLDQCFYILKDIRKQSSEKIQQSPQFRRVQQIRHKLLCFINALQTHITSIALQGSWQLFEQDLKAVKSMEDLYKKHTKYLKRVEFLCMLNKSSHDFYTKLEDIFVVALRFCYNLQSKNWRCNDHGIYTHPRYEKLLLIETDFVNLIKFIIYAGKKMSMCGYQTEIGEFIYMININGYYDN